MRGLPGQPSGYVGIGACRQRAHARAPDRALTIGVEFAQLRLEHEAANGLTRHWEELHQRCASRLLHLCLTNGGVYIKLGQHLAQLDYIVPEAYTRTLSALFQQTRSSSIADVTAVIEEDLGKPIGEAFASFDAEPIASASLAQVHRAADRSTGQPLAVKVQHRGLRTAAASDMATVAAAVHLGGWLFPDDFRLSWVLEEPRHLPLELDEHGRATYGGASTSSLVTAAELYTKPWRRHRCCRARHRACLR